MGYMLPQKLHAMHDVHEMRGVRSRLLMRVCCPLYREISAWRSFCKSAALSRRDT